MNESHELQDFLRAARGRVQPEDVGLVPSAGGGNGPGAGNGRVRRVPGLRREEVAQLAGVSVDYYSRLEQGRTNQVSTAVLTAVARALRLNEIEREYFFALASPPPPPLSDQTERVPLRVRPGIHQILDGFADSPAFVLGRGMRMLAMNRLARLVFFDFEAVPQNERNLARWTFLNPQARERYVDWEVIAAGGTANLRVEAGLNPDDRALNELIGELSVKSEDFRRLWAQHQVHQFTYGTKLLRHPEVGTMELVHEGFDIPGTADQKLFLYTAAPGSATADALRLLASWSLRN